MDAGLSGPNPLSPDRMTAAERLAEIAEILAAGLMRLRARTVQSFICRLRREFARLSRPPERSCRPRFSGGRGMTDTVLARVAALKAQPIANLKQQWRDLFETEPPPYNRRFLEHRLAYRIQELAYGGLKPETLKRLRATRRRPRRWRSGAAPPVRPRTGRSPARGSFANIRASSTASRCATRISNIRAGRTNRCPPSRARSPARAGMGLTVFRP